MDKRASIRFDKVIPVSVSTEEFGEMAAVARNVSSGGMLIETPSPAPLGSEVRIHFRIPGSQDAIVARAEVKHHYAFNFMENGQNRWARGMGVKFIEFVEERREPWRSSYTGARTLH